MLPATCMELRCYLQPACLHGPANIALSGLHYPDFARQTQAPLPRFIDARCLVPSATVTYRLAQRFSQPLHLIRTMPRREFGPSVAGAHVVSAKNSLHYDGREALEDYSFNCVAVDLLSSAHEAIEAEAGPRPARSDEWVGL